MEEVTQLPTHSVAPEGKRGDFPPRAKAFMGLVALVALAVAVPPVLDLDTQTGGWGTFLVVVVAASLAQLFVVTTSRNQIYHTTAIF